MDIVAIGTIILVVTLILFLVMGLPISASVGLSSVISLAVIYGFGGHSSGSVAMIVSTDRIFSGINSFSLIAIPFFVLAGNIMNRGGIAIRLVNLAKVMSGKLPGPLLHSNIVANMLFGSISGSGAAACAAVGGTMQELQRAEGYDPELSAAVNIASAPTGILIPPSNTLIVYATVAGSVSVSALFIAGYIPGIMWGIGTMIIAGIMAKKRGYQSSEKVPTKVKIETLIQAIPSLLLIVIVIGGIIAGVFTATEGSAIAVLYTLLLATLYKSMTMADLEDALVKTAEMTGIILFLIGVSSIMSWLMAYAGIPELIANALLGITDSPIIILLIMNVILLFVGTFMDATPAVLIFTPIFLPIALQLGMDPVQFGIVIVFNLSVGTITPPVGPIMFTGCKIGNVSIEGVVPKLLPFFVMSIFILFLVTYIPALSMWLPQTFGLV